MQCRIQLSLRLEVHFTQLEIRFIILNIANAIKSVFFLHYVLVPHPFSIPKYELIMMRVGVLVESISKSRFF